MTTAVRLTIGELAEAAGMTVRNIRNHQSRGLLQPPELEARTGYYGAEHLERLRLIQAMQADGFNLEAIRRLLVGLRAAAGGDDAGRGAGHADRRASSRSASARTRPRWPRPSASACSCPLGDGRFEAPSPALLRAAEEAVERGVGLAASLRVVEEVQAGCAAMARAFVATFVDELMRTDPSEPEAVAAVERLRPVAARTVLAVLDQAIAAEAGRAIEHHD